MKEIIFSQKLFGFENSNKDFRSLKVFVICVMLLDKYLVLNTITPMFLYHNGKAKRVFFISGSAGAEKLKCKKCTVLEVHQLQRVSGRKLSSSVMCLANKDAPGAAANQMQLLCCSALLPGALCHSQIADLKSKYVCKYQPN